MLKDQFKKIGSMSQDGENARNAGRRFGRKPQVPDGMFSKCGACGAFVYEEDARNAYYCCPKCGKHFRIEPYTRIRMVADRGSFREWDAGLTGEDPLVFPEYREKIEKLQESTGLSEAVVTGQAKIAGIKVAIGAMSPDFLMGSMGTAVGEKITRMVERATKERLPVILFCCSGGARMQEGIFSLMQMAKTSQALKRHDEAGLLYVSVLTDPTTGGVTASFAMLGDVILAEPEAMIGFAGARVIKQTIGGRLPEGFQSAEFLQKHGFVDRIVPREKMRRTLGVILKSSVRRPEGETPLAKVGDAAVYTEKTLSGREDGVSGRQAPHAGEDSTGEIHTENAENGYADNGYTAHSYTESGYAEKGRTEASEAGLADAAAWDRVLAARDKDRPYSGDYIASVFDGFMEFHGDRLFGDDRAVTGGIAAIGGRYVTVIGQQKGRNVKENKRRNFGMMSPDGYRKSLRLMKQAEKFGRPVILFVDTPGAFCGVEAEERGQGEAIARNLFELAGLKTPVLSVIIGEGGSGGALALAMADEVWMMENAVYSVLSPEGFAAILWKDGKRASEAAGVMKLTAAELKEAGIIEKIVPERTPANKDNMEELAETLRTGILSFLSKYGRKTPEELLDERYARFRKMGTPHTDEPA